MRGVLDRIEASLHRMARAAGFVRSAVELPHGPVVAWTAEGRGTLPPLVFVHGLALGSRAEFVPLMIAAQRLFSRVVALDLPGHGESAPLPQMDPLGLYDAAAQAIDRLVSAPPFVYGNSLGGAVALKYGLTRPTAGLFLTSPAGTPLEETALRPLCDGLLQVADGRSVPGSLWLLRLLSADVRARFDRPHIRALIASVTNEQSFSAPDVRALRVPTLLAWGRSDRVLPPAMLDWWRANLPATIETPRCGHVPHVEAPAWTWARLLRFARSGR